LKTDWKAASKNLRVLRYLADNQITDLKNVDIQITDLKNVDIQFVDTKM
jgi:hypothetical protein